MTRADRRRFCRADAVSAVSAVSATTETVVAPPLGLNEKLERVLEVLFQRFLDSVPERENVSPVTGCWEVG